MGWGTETPTRLIFHVTPVAKGRPRFRLGKRTYTPGKTRAFEADLRKEAYLLWKVPPLEGPLIVELYLWLEKPRSVKRYFPTARGDVDNYAKGVLDAMNGIIWHDDAQIVTLIAHKQYSRQPGVELVVAQVNEPEHDNERDCD